MMFIFGFFLGCVNIWSVIIYIGLVTDDDDDKDNDMSWWSFICTFIHIIIGLPVVLFLILMPFFGGFIVPPIVKNVSLRASTP